MPAGFLHDPLVRRQQRLMRRTSVAKQSVGRLEVRVGWHRTWQGARGRSCKQGCQPHPAPIQPSVAKPQAEKVEVRPLFGRRSKRKHGTLLTCPINRQTRAKKLDRKSVAKA